MFSKWQLDLLFAGWSIAYKGWTLKKYWEPHLQKTKLFLLESLITGSDLHVLGAGRLLDFPLTEILKRYSGVHLYDGDLGAIRKISKLSKRDGRIEGHEVEISGGLSKFSSILERHRHIDGLFSHPDFLQFSNPPHFLKLNSESQLVSLNLLSQLPLAYRQIFERWIIKHFGRDFLKESESEWLKEYTLLGQKIIKGHIDLLIKSGAKKIILISDVEQLFYPIGISRLPEPLGSPFKWEIDPAQAQPLEVTSSTCDIELGEEIFKNYNVTDRSYWPWHLAPAKGSELGIICKVEALVLERRLKSV